MRSMKETKEKKFQIAFKPRYSYLVVAGFGVLLITLIYIGFSHPYVSSYERDKATGQKNISKPKFPPIDKREYDMKMWELAGLGTSTMATTTSSTTPKRPWPVQAPYPLPGAILPYKRIVAYYGNFLSKQMGVLGEYPEDVMFAKLKAEVDAWESADPGTPVVPAIDYIAITAQGSPGPTSKYRLRMSDEQIEKAINLSAKVNGIVILDIQVGLSDLSSELPLLEKYLKLPGVHLAIDPEFSMKTGDKPGTVIGTFDASDVNYAAEFLAKIVRENNLAPKILVVHRFTEEMLTNYKLIKPLPEVQIVIDMDGWGTPEKKFGTYNHVIVPEPVQFTGFKLFYKNDLRPPSTRLLTPSDLLKLKPRPSFIQYQ